jgi:hypothetical protein
VSCYDPHSHVPTKLLYVCHIFVWLCNLSLIGPICGPSMLVTLLEIFGFAIIVAIKIQLYATHATANLCSCIRQVAHDIQLHATLCV